MGNIPLTTNHRRETAMTTQVIQDQITHNYENLRQLLVEGVRRGVLPPMQTLAALDQLHATMYAIERAIQSTKEEN
jgi:hypothetical protein